MAAVVSLPQSVFSLFPTLFILFLFGKICCMYEQLPTNLADYVR